MSVDLRVDGRDVSAAEGDTLLQAARRAGARIPTLCHVEGLRPDGGCRLCLVEIPGAPRLVAACHTPVAPGLDVVTDTPRLRVLRRRILQLWLGSLPEGALAREDLSPELRSLLVACDLPLPAPRTPETPAPHPHPYLRFDAGRCLVCRRCLHVCEQVQGQDCYVTVGRGAALRLSFGDDADFASSTCTACGACVEACPTGALWHRDHDRDREPDLEPDREPDGEATRTTRSTCGYCGVGCGVEVESRGARVVRITGATTSPVSRGHLCAKGRFGHGWQRAPDRLTRPRLREGDAWREVGWDEATSWLAGRLRALRGEHGPGALGVFTSSRSTNEAAYLLQKLFRATLGTNHVDCCARVCHASTALALQTATGTGAASACYDDLEKATCIVVAGANPTEAHPVLGARIRQVVRRGVPLVVIDPRRIELALEATAHLALRPGTNVALFNALAHVLVEEGLVDDDYARERLEGLEDLTRHLERTPVEEAAALCGLAPEAIRRVARLLGRAGPTLFVHGLGLSELTQGTGSVLALCNLAMLTGSIGRPGAGLLPLRGQNNVQGNADMGAMPDRVTGYQRLDAPEVRERLTRLWGAPPPEAPGRTIPEMLEAARRGTMRALWIQGEDVVQSDPDETRVREALAKLDLLVVQELFPSQTGDYAHLVLPAAGALEQDGTFTNGERRIQRVRAAVAPPGEARPDWIAVRDVARALGEHWSYEAPADVMDEIAEVAPLLFGGIRYPRLEGEGLQWPCPSRDHPGTATLHEGGFLRGRGRLTALDHVPSPEQVDATWPYLLVTGRVLQHYNVGSMTRRTPSRELVPGDLLEMHPDDVGREGLREGQTVALESRWGATSVTLAASPRVAPGTLFLSFHFPETHANRVVGPHADPLSRCPEYKITAVRVGAPQPPAGGSAAGDSWISRR